MTRSDTSKYMDEDGVQRVNVGLQSPSIPEQDDMSSDDETTSSSIMPIPETLRQMRCDLKRTISEMGDPSEVESTYTEVRSTAEETAMKVSNSLEELRKKYMLKNERSVTLKMNSANLMLDDILKSNSNSNSNPSENFQPKSLKKHEVKIKKFQETETSSGDESVCTIKQCNHLAKIPSPPSTLSPYELSVPFCPKHYKSLQPFYVTSEKSDSLSKKGNEDGKKKMTLVEKLQNLPVNYKIQSLYKAMHNFYKLRKKQMPTEKEMSSKEDQQNPVIIRDDEKFTHENKEFFPHEYHQRKMVFDLLENNDASHNFNKNMERKKIIIDENEKCSCQEVKSPCTCAKCICSATHFFPENHQSKNISFQTLKSEHFPAETTASPITQDSRGCKKHCYKERKLFERTDIYYFDHGNSAYYRTTDTHPMRYTECLVERTDEYATKFWAEFFGVIEIGIAFLVSFILQFYRFCFTSIIRSLTVGLLQIFSDYFFKPFLTITFNGIVQPCLILGYNIATSFRDLCLPISETFGFYVKEVANLFRACRLVEVNRDCSRQPPCNCENKV